MTRNPYLLLGIDYGTPPDRARRAFARAARRVRRASDTDVTVEELNAALHEVQNLEGDPFDLIEHVRVPADPEVFAPRGPGLLDPPPEPRARTTAPQDLDEVRAAAAEDVHAVLDAVVGKAAIFEPGYVFRPDNPGGPNR